MAIVHHVKASVHVYANGLLFPPPYPHRRLMRNPQMQAQQRYPDYCPPNQACGNKPRPTLCIFRGTCIRIHASCSSSLRFAPSSQFIVIGSNLVMKSSCSLKEVRCDGVISLLFIFEILYACACLESRLGIWLGDGIAVSKVRENKIQGLKIFLMSCTRPRASIICRLKTFLRLSNIFLWQGT